VPPPGHGDRPSDSWGWTSPGGDTSPLSSTTSGPSSALDSLSRRLLQLAGVLSGILILLVAYTWSRGEGEYSLNPIAEAAARTQRASGARSEIRAVYSIPGASRSISMRGEGVYNSRTGRSQVTLIVATPVGPMTMEAVGDDRTVYMRSKLLQPGLPPGDEWMAIETGLGRSSETSFASSSGPGAQLKLLQAVTGEVETLGEETVDGVETTRYRGSYDLPAYARFLRSKGSEAAARQYERLAKAMPSTTEVETWVDGAGLVRRARLTMDVKNEKTGLIESMDMTEDFSDFGVAPAVGLPDPSTVFDATPLVRAELGLLDGSNEMLPHAPAGPPLSPGAFNAEAQKVCAGVERRLERLGERGRPLAESMKNAIEQNGLQARSTLEAVREAIDGYYEPSAQAFKQALSGFARIAPPAAKAADFRRLLRLGSLQVEILVAENRAMQTGAYSLSKDLSDRLDHLSHRADQLGEKLGLDDCTSGDSEPSGQPA
jgi:hypothetical protein